MDANKVQFNLKNSHYAKMNTGGESPTWGSPVKIPGSVSLALDPQGELSKFYADGITYWQSSSNNGYEGDAEFALIPDQMLQDIWGVTKTETDNVLIENATAEPSSFAWLFQIDGDKSGRYYCLYNCTATRPAIKTKTNSETKEPETQSIKISAVPLEDGRVMAKTTNDTSEEAVQNWFKKVYEKSPGREKEIGLKNQEGVETHVAGKKEVVA